MNNPKQPSPETALEPRTGGGSGAAPCSAELNNAEDVKSGCLHPFVLSVLSLTLERLDLWCDNCKCGTEHVFADPDIQCKECHWVTTSVH